MGINHTSFAIDGVDLSFCNAEDLNKEEKMKRFHTAEGEFINRMISLTEESSRKS
ncbi:MAG: hypothetical protein WD037_10585 [Balneolales bacterium]